MRLSFDDSSPDTNLNAALRSGARHELSGIDHGKRSSPALLPVSSTDSREM
jgi:hypothetical protein